MMTDDDRWWKMMKMMKAETAEMIVLLCFWLRSGADLEATDSLRRLPIHVACEAWVTILLVQLKYGAMLCYAMLCHAMPCWCSDLGLQRELFEYSLDTFGYTIIWLIELQVCLYPFASSVAQKIEQETIGNTSCERQEEWAQVVRALLEAGSPVDNLDGQRRQKGCQWSADIHLQWIVMAMAMPHNLRDGAGWLRAGSQWPESFRLPLGTTKPGYSMNLKSGDQRFKALAGPRCLLLREPVTWSCARTGSGDVGGKCGIGVGSRNVMTTEVSRNVSDSFQVLTCFDQKLHPCPSWKAERTLKVPVLTHHTSWLISGIGFRAPCHIYRLESR